MRREFTLASKKLSIDFLFTGKYNVLIGNSGVGKTYLIQEVRKTNAANLWSSHPPFDVLACDEAGNAVTTSLGEAMQHREGDVFLLDEELVSRLSGKDWNAIQDSPNYFLFIVRERLPQIPYAPWNIFRLEGNEKHLRMVPVYNQSLRRIIGGCSVLCEDVGTGVEVARKVLRERGYSVDAIGGNGNLISAIKMAGRPLHALVDLCGYGAMYSSLLDIAGVYGVDVCDYKSFEHEALIGLGYSETDLDPSENELLRSRSEEAHYTSLLSDIVKSGYDISYDKGSSDVANALLTGVYKHGSMVIRGCKLNPSRMYKGLRGCPHDGHSVLSDMRID